MKRILVLPLLLFLLGWFAHPVNAQLGRLGSLAKTKSNDKGITNDIHAKYVNQIVFMSEDTPQDQVDPAKFKTEFNLGDPIHFRVYLDQSLMNGLTSVTRGTSRSIVEVHSRFQFVFTIDDAEPLEIEMMEDAFDREEKNTWTTWRGAFKPEDKSYYLGMREWEYFMTERQGNLTEGSHKVKVEVYPYIYYPKEKRGDLMASSTITLNVSSASFDPNDPNTCFPEAGMNDAALEAKILEAFLDKGWKETPKKVIITSRAWFIERHPVTGIILRRTIEAAVCSTRGDADCFYQKFNFSQDYDGSGYQDYTYMNGIGSQNQVPCGCFKGLD